MAHRDDAEAATPAAGAEPPAEERAQAAAAPQAPAEAGEFDRQLADARAQAQANWDRYLRTAADLENLRRRSQQELERVQKYALERFAGELLAVKDSLEMGLAAANAEGTVEALREGTEATLKLLGSVFEKFGIDEIDPAGAPFDPTLHEAISVQVAPEAQGEHVLTVVQKGYVLNGRLLRPARVIVARPEQETGP
jgi:molecular chaperone GrpE